MSIFKFLSLKGRFLITPIIGAILVTLLIVTSYQKNQSQVTLFAKINEYNLPQISQISQVSIKLSQNQLTLNNILDSFDDIVDEEIVYAEGRAVLNNLHRLEQNLLQEVLQDKQLIINGKDVSQRLTKTFYAYRESVISAIELSTVDPKLSQRELNNAEKSLTNLNSVLLFISQNHIKQMEQASRDISTAINATDFITIFSITVLLLMLLMAFYLANHLSKGLDYAVHALVSLSHGNTNVHIQKSDDQYLEQLTSVVTQFKTSLQENERYKRELKSNLLELSISKERFASMLELSPTGLITIDEGQNIILFNKAAENLFGYRSDEMLGRPISQLMPQRFRQKHLHHVINYEVTTKSDVTSMRPGNIIGLKKNGDEFHLDAHISKFVLDSGTLMNVSLVDLTQRNTAENELKRYFHIVSNSNDMIAYLDENYVYRLVNSQYLSTFKTTEQQMIGQHVRDIAGDERFFKRVKPKLDKAYTGEDVVWQNWMETPTGKRFLNINYKPFVVDEKIMGITITIQDFTTLQNSQDSLRKLQNYLSNIIDSMPSILIGVDEQGLITQWNKMIQDTTHISKEQALGKPLTTVFPRLTPEMANIDKAIKTKQQQNNYKQSFFDHGETHYEDVTVYPLIANGVQGAVIRVDDVTEKVRLEEMMIQSEKMLSVGGLAAGMAHEINNPLAGMMQTADVMQSRLINFDLPANIKAADAAGISMENIQHYMEARGIVRMTNAIRESGHRVAEIVENMLSFSRKSESTVSSHNLSELVEKTILLASTDYDLKKEYDFKTIHIDKHFDDTLCSVPCEGAKIQQVLLNLFRNGAQAMQQEKNKKPVFTIRTYHNKERQMACIDVEDNGPGMDDVIRKRVFEPFFTTKPVGVGTGLGLSVSYFIITENHNGHLGVTSTPGEGSCFTLCLPFQSASEI